MTIIIKNNNKWLSVKNAYLYQNNFWHTIKHGYYKQDNQWQLFWQNIKIANNNLPQTSINIYDFMGKPKHKGQFIFINNAEIIATNGEIALTTGQFPEGSTLTIINNSLIAGYGGNGGSLYQKNNTDGGDAISIGTTCTLDNSNGYIFGGGGGGGGIKVIFYSGGSIGSEDMFLSGGGGQPNGQSIKFVRSGSANSSKRISEPTTSPNLEGGSLYFSISSSMHCQVISGSGGEYGQMGKASKKVSDTISSGWLFRVSITTMIGGKAGLAINKNGNQLTLINPESERIKGEIL